LTGIDKSKLPVDYFWNKSAWMQKSIWNKYLELLNKKMKRLDKKILLLVDNATVHAVDNPELLTNITIHYLPPNTTAHLQPADAWEAVTSRTIHNCWKKTGILPSFAASPLPFDDNSNGQNDNNEDDDDEIKEVQELLNQYNNFTSGELISAKEFILIDDDDNY